MNELKKLFDKQVKVFKGDEREIPNAFGRTQAIFFVSVPYLGKETTTFAYIGTPNIEKPQGGYPAIVLVHGGGGCAFYEWVEYWNKKGYVAIAFDCSGQQYGSCKHDGKGTAEINPNGRYLEISDNGSFENDEESVCNSWTYHNVANIILAHNLLRTNKNVNKDKIVLTGISWGGVLTTIVSGIDDRFLAVAPVFGTGYLLESHVFTNKNVPMIDYREKWEELFDPISYVEKNVKSTLFTMGMNDHAFSPKNAQRTYGRVQGEVIYSYRKELLHYHRWKDEEQMIHVARFMDLKCKNIALPFQLIGEKRENNQFSIQVDNGNAIKKAYFNYTLSNDEDCMLWKWEQVEIAMVKNKATAEIPQGTKYCFVELSDGAQEEFILSSSLQIFE